MIRLDPDRRRVYGPRGQTWLSFAEHALLQTMLVAGFNQPVSHKKLTDAAWPWLDSEPAGSRLRTCICRVRSALTYIGGARIVAVYPGAYKIEAIPTPIAFARAA